MLNNAMAETKKKAKYLTKTVKFGEKQFTLFSLDGVTWSSRRDELHMILERQEIERKSFNQIIGEQPAEKAAEGSEEKEKVDGDEEPDLIAPEDDEILPITAEPTRKPIKIRAPIAHKALKQKVHAASDLKATKNSKIGSTPLPKASDKKSRGAPVANIATPKSRGTSKPAKKIGKTKAKKRA